jgi:hypothetical protein
MPLADLPYNTLREVFKFLSVADLSSLDDVCLYFRLTLPFFYHSFTPTQLNIFDSRSHVQKRKLAFAADGSLLVVTNQGSLIKFDGRGRATLSTLRGVSSVVCTGSYVAAIANAKSIKICKYLTLFEFMDSPVSEEVSDVLCGIGNNLLLATSRSEILMLDEDEISRLPRIPDACLEKGSIVDLAMIDQISERCIYALLSDGRLLRLLLPCITKRHGNFLWETLNRTTLEIATDDFHLHHHNGLVLNDDRALLAFSQILGIRATGGGLLAAVQGQKVILWRAKKRLAEIELDTPVKLLVDFAIKETLDGVEIGLYFGAFVRCVELVSINSDQLVEIDHKSHIIHQ